MALQPIRLNLVPPPSYWRQNHLILGWTALGTGVAFMLLVTALTIREYRRARSSEGQTSKLQREIQVLQSKEDAIARKLRLIDVAHELPRWKLAERILLERSIPWSRLTAELERCLVNGVRVKSLQRTKDNEQRVLLKLRAESRDRKSEADFIENLQKNSLFIQVVLERETERAGGGWDFDLMLPAVPVPPPYEELPKDENAGQAVVSAPPLPQPPRNLPSPTQSTPVPREPTPPVGTVSPRPTPNPMPQTPDGSGRLVPRVPGLAPPQRSPEEIERRQRLRKEMMERMEERRRNQPQPPSDSPQPTPEGEKP